MRKQTGLISAGPAHRGGQIPSRESMRLTVRGPDDARRSLAPRTRHRETRCVSRARSRSVDAESPGGAIDRRAGAAFLPGGF